MAKPRVAPGYIAAFAGVGAAIYYLLLWLPGVPIIGLPGAKMEIGASLAPLLGVILGPYIGFLSVLIGNVAKFLTTPSPYSLPFIPCAPLSAFAIAMLITRRWKIPMLILAITLIASLFTPPFYPLTEFDTKLGMHVWQVYLLAYFDKIVALALIPIALDLVQSISTSRKYIGFYMLMFIGREFDKALGCFIFSLPAVYGGIFGIKKLSTVRALYTASPLYYLITYLIEALVVFIIAIPVIKALLKVPGVSEVLYVKNVKEQKIL